MDEIKNRYLDILIKDFCIKDYKIINKIEDYY